jgi:DNA-directed RNA polymerase subunit RPC12/RpoP
MDVEYEVTNTSSWRWIYTCTACGDHTDGDENIGVCAKCGHRYFTRRVGRWHALCPRLNWWRQFVEFLFWLDSHPVRFNVEFKESPDAAR